MSGETISIASEEVLGKRIGFGSRFFAVILNVVFNVIGGVIFGLLFGAELIRQFASKNEILILIQGFFGSFVGVVIGLFFFTVLNGVLEALYGASLGKLALGIRIGDASGTKAKIWKLLERYAIKNIALIFSIFASILGVKVISQIGGVLGVVVLIGCLAIFGKTKQALHDMLVKTAVYKNRDLK